MKKNNMKAGSGNKETTEYNLNECVCVLYNFQMNFTILFATTLAKQLKRKKSRAHKEKEVTKKKTLNVALVDFFCSLSSLVPFF